MWFIWVLIVMMIAFVAFAAGVKGASAAAKKNAGTSPPHEHMWEAWERGDLQIVSDTGKHLYTVDVQNRVCMTCNFTQREKIISK